MQTNKLKNLLLKIYANNNTSKKVIIIRNKQIIKTKVLNNKQTLFSIYKKLYANNFNNNVTIANLKTLNNVYYINNYLSKYKSIYASAYKQKNII